MPSRPARPCKYPGCIQLVHGRFCAAHVQQVVDSRPSAARRGYNAEWRRIRETVLTQHPYCSCGKPAHDVDHIVPLTRGGSHDLSNLQALCKSCHRRKTRRESLARA